MASTGELEDHTQLTEKMSKIARRLEMCLDKEESLTNVIRELTTQVEANTQARAEFDSDRFKKEREIELAANENFLAWRNLAVRKYWVLSGVKPAVHGGKHYELKEALSYTANTTREVTAQMAQMSGFDVGDFMPDCPTLDPATDMSIVEQMEIFIDVVMIVVRGAESNASLARCTRLREGLQRGVEIVRQHTRERPRLVKITGNRERMISLVNEDLKEWSCDVFHAATSAGAQWDSPPDIGSLPPVPVPAWKQINAFVQAGGLLNLQATADFVSPGTTLPSKKRGRKNGH
eukprot:jgi/Undpi1/4157/HiC_scaffold_16.g07524.m1